MLRPAGHKLRGQRVCPKKRGVLLGFCDFPLDHELDEVEDLPVCLEHLADNLGSFVDIFEKARGEQQLHHGVVLLEEKLCAGMMYACSDTDLNSSISASVFCDVTPG